MYSVYAHANSPKIFHELWFVTHRPIVHQFVNLKEYFCSVLQLVIFLSRGVQTCRIYKFETGWDYTGHLD